MSKESKNAHPGLQTRSCGLTVGRGHPGVRVGHADSCHVAGQLKEINLSFGVNQAWASG